MTEMAEDMAAAGWSVDVVCGYPSYLGAVRAPPQEVRGNVHIRRLSPGHFDRNKATGRLANWLWFGLQCVLRFPAWYGRYEWVVAVTNPALMPHVAAAFRRLDHGARLLLMLHDIFPDNACAVGRLARTGLSTKVFRRLNRWAFSCADCVVTLGPIMRNYIDQEYGVANDRLVVVPPWQDAPLRSTAVREETRAHYGWAPDDFVMLYAGNAGVVQGVALLQECMVATLQSHERVRFCFSGSGLMFNDLVGDLANQFPAQVQALPFLPPDQYEALSQAVDCGVVSMDMNMAGLVLPSKTIAYLARGLPIVALVPRISDVAAVVEMAECGAVVQTPEAFAAAARSLAVDKEALARYGKNAVASFAGGYSRSECMGKIIQILSQPRDIPCGS
jgi:glycosyltransferase involved in cell wall biosynthesis